MKIIDLLNKIANGENVEFIFKNGCSIQDNISLTDALIDYLSINYGDTEDDTNWLNDEVEIIEENKIPEKLEEFDIQGLEVAGYSMTQAEYLLEDGVKENRKMINLILDYLKSKGDE